MKKIRWLSLSLAICTGCFSLSVSSQEAALNWPLKPIQIVSPFPPGGSDIPLRIQSAMVSERTKWNFVIDYKPGASGAIAAGFVAKSAPDGYTHFVSSTSLALTEILEHPVPFDGVKDFTPVYQLTRTQQVLVVNAALPVKSVQEYIAYAKANPGTINFGLVGMTAQQRLVAEYMNETFGIRVNFVPYKGGAEVGTALVRGELQASLQPRRNMLAGIKAGSIRPLGIASKNVRLKEIPGVISIAEQGFPDFDYFSWTGLHAPAGTPDPVVTRINVEFNRVASLPELHSKFEVTGEAVGGGSVEEFRKYYLAQRDRWVSVAKRIGIKLGAS